MIDDALKLLLDSYMRQDAIGYRMDLSMQTPDEA